MSTASVRHEHRVRPARLFAYASFAIMLGGWVAFLVGLAIWKASWDETVRLTAITALAVAYTYAFTPREPK